MKFAIEQADIRRDRGVLVATLHSYLTPLSDEIRFDWLYGQNPHGPARAWLARDRENGEVVGTSAAFSRRAIVNGKEKNGWVLGDFCMADKYRSLGPALQLQRATLAAFENDGADFYYDFPSRKMMAIYLRCGITPATQIVRLAKPLRLEGKLRRSAKSMGWMRPAGSIGNLALRLFDLRAGNQKEWNVLPHEGLCGDEFTACSQRMDAGGGIEIQRSAEYLNWRYLRHPYTRYEILTARRTNQLEGYLIFSRDDQTATIAEWRVGNNHQLLKVLIWELIRKLRKAGTMTLNAFLQDTDPRLALLRSMGFWSRESSPVVVHWPRLSTAAAAGLLLMHGDRDS